MEETLKRHLDSFAQQYKTTTWMIELVQSLPKIDDQATDRDQFIPYIYPH